MHENRLYRNYAGSEDLISFNIRQGESDIMVSAERDIKYLAEPILKQIRVELTKYIAKNPAFEASFVPVRAEFGSPGIIREMAAASSKVKVGPMASVAGAVAESLGKKLLKHTKQVIVENGGDIYIKSSVPRKVAVFAGESPFSEKIFLEIDPSDTPVGICTSAGTVGPSFSFGAADAVVVLSRSAALADAAATALGNMVKKAADVDTALEAASKIKGIKGALIIKGDRMGLWGKIKVGKAGNRLRQTGFPVLEK